MNIDYQFCSFVRLTRNGLIALMSILAVSANPVFAGKIDQRPGYCPGYLPDDAVPSGHLRLCKYRDKGHDQLYACQNFISKSGHYRLYFRGGQHPRLIAQTRDKRTMYKTVSLDESASAKPACHLPPPAQIPGHTQFVGAAVCDDAHDQAVPCTVFRDRAFRASTYSDYLTLFDPDGNGPNQTSLVYTGSNPDALPAEFLYQIGVSLIKTDCCKDRGAPINYSLLQPYIAPLTSV